MDSHVHTRAQANGMREQVPVMRRQLITRIILSCSVDARTRTHERSTSFCADVENVCVRGPTT